MGGCRLEDLHAQITPQLHNPDGTASYLDHREEQDEANDYGTIDRPPRRCRPLAVASPGEVVEIECAHHLENVAALRYRCCCRIR